MFDVTGNSFSYSTGSKFSAKNRDLDVWVNDCSSKFASNTGWWFRACSFCNLNGNYITSNNDIASTMSTNDNFPIEGYSGTNGNAGSTQ